MYNNSRNNSDVNNTRGQSNGQKMYTQGTPMTNIPVQGNEGNSVPMNQSMYYQVPTTYYQQPQPQPQPQYYGNQNARNTYQGSPYFRNNEQFNFVPPQKTPMEPQILENNILTPETVAKRKAESTSGTSRSKAAEVGPEYDKSTKSLPRKRALTACDNCRFRKVKCDNARPSCGACVKNGIEHCHYKVDDHISAAAFDSSAEKILNKLDLILNKLDGNSEINLPIKKKMKSNPSPNYSFNQYSEVLEDCTWDFSVTSILKWNYLMKKTNTTTSEYEEMVKKMVCALDTSSLTPTLRSLEGKISSLGPMELFLNKNFSDLISSFLSYSHSKIPILDSIRLMESIEMYKILRDYKKDLTFLFLLESYNEESDPPHFYVEALKEKEMDDNPFYRDNYRYLCAIIPVFILMCAIGMIATPMQLNNFSNYKNSFEQRSDLKIGCIPEDEIPDNMPQDRLKISQMLFNYANLLTTCFPFSLVDNSLTSVQFHLLLSQYHLYVMNPLISHKNIITANHHLMFYLQKRKASKGYEISDSDKDVIDRLFWTSLKLECELKSELSPYVPSSGITKVLPTISFPSLPEFATSPIERTGNHREEIIQLANVYNDEYSWYFFLTEVAYRKVDNALNNEVYSYEGKFYGRWDDLEFSDSYIWGTLVKYLAQYNGILYSLHPNLRAFILNQTNIDEIHRVLKQRFLEKKEKENNNTHIPDHLSEFFSDDIKIKNQSDSVVFMQSRVVASKLMLFRPLIYLLMEGKITVKEILVASFEQINLNKSSAETEARAQFETPGESDSEGASRNLVSKENFSDIIIDKENSDGEVESFEITDIREARKRILRTFISDLISIPKLHVPNLAGHRHPGLWYYIRNIFVSNIYLYVIYSKFSEIALDLSDDPEFQQFLIHNHIDSIELMMKAILSKDSVNAALEHSLVIYDYWKDESKDCTIYYDYTKKLLNSL